MNRRTFLWGLMLGTLAAPLGVGAQQPNLPTIGFPPSVLALADQVIE